MKRRRNAGDQRRFIVVEGVYRMYGRERERSGAGAGCDGLYAPSACAAGGIGGVSPPDNRRAKRPAFAAEARAFLGRACFRRGRKGGLPQPASAAEGRSLRCASARNCPTHARALRRSHKKSGFRRT
jgi:hypothetical protein